MSAMREGCDKNKNERKYMEKVIREGWYHELAICLSENMSDEKMEVLYKYIDWSTVLCS